MLLFLVGILTGTWAQTLVQDADGYYQIGTAADWQAFATLVVTNPTANARMTADIDLGECQAMLGDSEHEDNPTYAYQGTFDGQGHTLTVHYTGTSQTAPFAMLKAATIRNIHVDGTINNTSGSQPSVIARVVYGTTTVENVWSSVITTDTRTGWDEAAAFVGCVDGYKSGHLVMRDCLFTGTVNSSGSYNGCFVGYINSGGSATVSSCLSLGTFNYTGGSYDIARGTYSNCFVKQWPGTIPASMQATDEKLASGEIAYKLQAGRGQMFWGQTIGEDPLPVMTSDESKRVYRTPDGFSNNPDDAMLQTDADGYYKIGSVDDWRAFATMVDEGFSYVDARMTADINLGDCQTMIGSSAHPFGGVFDGQGHKLTVNYVSTDIRIAPFWYITGATIRNLHTAGTMQISGSAGNSGGGIAGYAQGVNTIEHCHSSVKITATGSGDTFGGIVGVNYRGTLTINDCIFDGSIVTEAKMHNGGFVGYTDNGTTTATNCLLTAVFDCGTGSNTVTFLRYSGTVTNCFYLNGIGVLQGTQITDAQLASGEIAYKLQAGRGKMFWGQTIGVDLQPVLTSDESKRVYRTMEGFSNTPDEGELQIDDDGYYLLGSANDWKRFAMLIDDGFANVNARMTKDIDLGDDQTMVGNGHYSNVSYRKYFSGIFDGQGHTLTVHYVTDEAAQKMYTDLNIPLPSPGYYGFAPFVYVWGGTIRNLHTAGTITATHEGVAGIVGWTNGNTLIERCHSSVDITYTNGARGAAGLTYNSYNDNHVLTINDCIYDGTLTAGTNKTGSSGFVVYSWAGVTNISNSLLTATFANGMGSSDCATFVRNKTGNISNSYFRNPLGTIQGNQATADELANGKVAFYLQNGRTDLFWGQAIGTDPQPVLTSDESKRVYRAAEGYTNDPTQAIADQDIIPLTYTRDADNNLTITGFDTGFTPPANYQLVIPDDIDGSPVVGIDNSAFYQKSNFTSLYIGKNVKTIGDEAFRQAKGMTSVTFASDCVVESFGNSAFRGCDELTSFTMPNTVKTIGEMCFQANPKLTTVTISNQLSVIASRAFAQNPLLNNVEIPASVNTIKYQAFMQSTGLTSIEFPANVTKLEEDAFRDCSGLTAVTIPATITSMDKNVFWNSGVKTADVYCSVLGQGAFYQCASLETVTIHEGVTTLGLGAFYGCTKLQPVDIPQSVTTMNENVFRDCSALTTVNFANGIQLETIPQAGFYNSGLTAIVIPASVTTIGNDAFGKCASLPSITIPATVASMGTSAFSGCSSLTTVTFANGINLATIPASCFYECRALESISIPVSVTKIDNEAFRRCSAMTSVNFPSSTALTTIGDGAFRGCAELTSIVVPESVETIGSQGFQACTNLEQVTLPSTLKVISPQLFQESKMSDDFVIPASVTTIGDNAFRSTTALGSITIPASVTSLGAAAFYAATGLEEVVFEDGIQLQQILNDTFRGSSILRCTLPASVTTIGNTAFCECKLLESVTLPNGLNTIGNSAFRYCEKLNDVTLPGSLISVQDWAFANCTAMENLTIEEGVSNISRDVFQFSGMKNVVLPSTLDFIGVNLFHQCSQLEVLDLSKCVNVWELYNMTTIQRTGGSGQWNIFFGVPATTKIIMPPYAQATLGANDEVKTIEFNLTKDADDFYLINNADDWDKFVAYSRAYPNINGRITADLDLTTHQGKLGVGNGESYYITYQGTLDGQGHTLTISYKNGKEFTGALIAYVENATVKNLHVKGSVDAYYRVVGGIVGFVKPSTTLTIQDCESSVNFTVTPSTTNMHVAGFIGQGKTGDIYLTDCLYNGTITGVSSFRYAAGFMGWMDNGGHITYNYCLNNGTFTNMDMNYAYALGATQSKGQTTAAVCYVNIEGGAKVSPENLFTPVTTDQLKTGMVAYRLQGGRDDQHWGQKLGTDPAPRLTTEAGTRVYRGQTYTNIPTEYTGLKKDDDEYYLIGSPIDWEEFAALVADFPLSNARMTADFEIVDNTMVGTKEVPYQGTFDGQGHTLTFHFDTKSMPLASGESWLGAAPFWYVSDATFRNIHTAGSVIADKNGAAGLIGWTKGSLNTIDQCWSEVNFDSSNNTADTFAGFVAFQYGLQLNISNCVYTGKIHSTSNLSHAGFVGYHYNGNASVSNSLLLLAEGSDVNTSTNSNTCFYTFVRYRPSSVTINNCYYLTPFGVEQGTQITAAQLASGYVTLKLQGKSDDLIWAQTIGTDERPQLVVFNPTAQRVYRTLDGFSNNSDQAALKQDAEGYYLIGTVDDWKMLAILVDEGETDAKARMTADIDLGDDQTMIGSGPADADVDGSTQIKFQGIFDGQGHTLTINYVATEQITGPFRFIQEATIKNLHVKGTISTEYIHAGGIVGICFGQQKHSYIENCISSVNIISSRVNTGGFYGGSMHGGIIGKLQYYGQLHIDDCIFNGSISGETRDVVWGGFVGLPDGTVTISNSLQVGTFDCEGVISGSNGSGTFSSVFGNGYASHVNVVNSYYLNQLGNAQGTKATAETLADGTVTTALQAGRDEELWVQYGALPMLKLFAADYILGDANGDGKVDINDALSIVNYLMGNPPANFNEPAADVNVDGQITIADAVGVVNIILNK